MEKQYQLFYRENGGQTKHLNLRATDKRMAVKFFEVLMPGCKVVHITSDPLPMSPAYVDSIADPEDELLKQMSKN